MNHSKLETTLATQAFYSSVQLHASTTPEDECPDQRLTYDRINLLKNYPPEAEFMDTKQQNSPLAPQSMVTNNEM